jgi:hypothetical protein
MQQGLLFLPCLALLLLTILAMWFMLRGRQGAVKRGEISAAYFKTYDTGEKLPRKARQADRCYHNLVESTPPFYFVCTAAMALGKVEMMLLVLAWAYVAMRALQSFVHLTSNKIGLRSISFGLGWVVLLAMAIRIALTVF